MAKMLRALNKCYACGRERTRAYLGFDIQTLKTYCLDERGCVPSKRPDRPLYPNKYEEVMDEIHRKFPEDVAAGLEELIGKSVSFRTTPTASMYLMKFAQEHNLTTKNSILTEMIEKLMELYPLDDVQLERLTFEVKGYAPNWKSATAAKPKEETAEETKPV